MPLGSGAIAGSTIKLDRELIAKLLDFPAISQNSMDAVSDRDFACELLAAHRAHRHAPFAAERGRDSVGVERVQIHHDQRRVHDRLEPHAAEEKIPTSRS